ncbi:MAG: hypothetical protein AAGD33_18085 [Actinomycetota bacterium]
MRRPPSGRPSVVASLVVALVASLGVLVTPIAAGPVAADTSDTPTALTPVGPCRTFDSRETPDRGRLDDSSWRLQITGDCDVTEGARAVVLSVVVTNVTASGFATIWSSGDERPTVSNLNYRVGHTIANTAIVPLSDDGTVDVYLSGAASFAVDVTGFFADAPDPVAAGRFVPVDARRILDTRTSDEYGSGDLVVPLPDGVPDDASLLAVTVTSVAAAGRGYLSVFTADDERRDTSIVNTDDRNRTRANLSLVPVTPDGFVVARSVSGHVLVDIWGYFTGPSADEATDGLFVPRAPERVWDSRESLDPIHPEGTVERAIAPSGASAIVANVTGIDLTAGGYTTVHAAGTPRPEVSSLNYRWNHPVAAATISRVSDRGVAFFSSAGAHMAVDLAGWFLGEPAAATTPVPANDFPSADSDVVIISDSAHAGIRWNGALGYLQGAQFNAQLESCRRLIGVSCRGREGYAPRTALSEMRQLEPDKYSTMFMLTGYNDWSGSFPSAVEQIMAEARAKGIDRVVWVTYRENVGYVSPSSISNRNSFIANNRHLRAVVDSQRYPELSLADWHTYSFFQSSWLTSDGVHLTSSGAPQSAIYLSRKLAFLERRPCPPGIGGPLAPGGWCADPDVTGPA